MFRRVTKLAVVDDHEALRHGPWGVFYAIIEFVVDQYLEIEDEIQQDLDDIAILQRRLQRYEATVDARADGAVPDLGMHGIREIDRGRAGR